MCHYFQEQRIYYFQEQRIYYLQEQNFFFQEEIQKYKQNVTSLIVISLKRCGVMITHVHIFSFDFHCNIMLQYQQECTGVAKA